MSLLDQTLDTFINDQIKGGTAATEKEAEEQIIAAVMRRELDRKLARAQQQVANGEVEELNDEFMAQFFAEAKKRNGIT